MRNIHGSVRYDSSIVALCSHAILGIFEESSESILELYFGLGCECLLVPRTRGEYPQTPGLTSHGLALFLTYLVMAYPEKEHKRFENIFQRASKDKWWEPLPNQLLPRHLLPSESDIKCKERIVELLKGLGYEES